MLRRESHSACYPNRSLQSLLAEQFYSCSVCRRNTEYGKWLVSQKGRFSDQLEQWNRIVAINPPTCDPYIFYGKMMATLERVLAGQAEMKETQVKLNQKVMAIERSVGADKADRCFLCNEAGHKKENCPNKDKYTRSGKPKTDSSDS